jgi:hypothetical protein
MGIAAFLAFVAVILTMITDNTGSYVHVMAPLGIMIGTALLPSTGLASEMAALRSRERGQIQIDPPLTFNCGSQS